MRRRRDARWARARHAGRAASCGAIALIALFVASGAPSAEPPRPPTVVLISLDGTRPSDVTADAMPRLAGLAELGAVAKRMLGVVPTNTFPSHATLVTGVSPERHGLVNNVFEDPERGRFAKQDIATWLDVEPLWSLLERAGVRTASFYWVGSEGAWPGGRAPSEWKRFSSRTGERKKVDRILEWLDRPPAEQPRFVTSWFHGADHPAHHEGPGTPAVDRALAEQDVEIGRLIDGVVRRGRAGDTTLLFVSDHGMTEALHRVDLAAALAAEDGIRARVYGIGGFATVVLRDADRGDREKIRRIVARAGALGLEAIARDEAPADWRVGHPRFGDVVVRAPLGTAIVYAGLDLAGFHGYDPAADDMAALFMAFGRGVRPGTRLGEVRAIDVAPTVLALLDQPIPDRMEGRVIDAIVPFTVATTGSTPVDEIPEAPATSANEVRP